MNEPMIDQEKVGMQREIERLRWQLNHHDPVTILKRMKEDMPVECFPKITLNMDNSYVMLWEWYAHHHKQKYCWIIDNSERKEANYDCYGRAIKSARQLIKDSLL